jgi:hypothetical protein
LPSFAPPEQVRLRAAFVGAVAHVIWGDDLGACAWRALRLDADAAGDAVATLDLPSDGACAATWIEASTDPAPAERSGRRLTIARDHLRAPGHSDIFARWPTTPTPGRVFDGAARASARQDARVRRGRRVALGALALSILVEAALVLGAGLQRGPDALNLVESPRRTRVGAVAAAVALLIVLGLAMGLEALIQL